MKGTGGGPPTPWLVAVDKWERAGRPGGDKPPGARRVEPVPFDAENRAQALDYRVRSNSWLLRPEVCLCSMIHILSLSLLACRSAPSRSWFAVPLLLACEDVQEEKAAVGCGDWRR